jgi:hypothetical protein
MIHGRIIRQAPMRYVRKQRENDALMNCATGDAWWAVVIVVGLAIVSSVLVVTQ